MLFLKETKTSVKASPDIIYVSTNHSTIQEAINQADPGDTIFVRKGTYYENVIVNKSVSLVGEDRDSTIVDGNRQGSVISIVANNVNISGFTIRYSGNDYYDSGIYVDHSSGNDISHNTITNNRDGMYLDSSSNNVFSENTITNNRDGINLYSSSNNMVSENTISSNSYYGISLFSSSNNVFSENTITNNRDGMYLYSSSNNVVSENTISSNSYYGMYLTLDSSNNIIYFNNFNDTHTHVWTDSTNVWDDGSEGNYWSDYTGQDLNADGIGDTAYVIDVNNRDNHPLMGMFSDFNVALEKETYHVTTICNSTISEFRFEIGPETGNKMIRFNVTGKDSIAGFCRITIPTELMNYPYIVVVGTEEITTTILDVSNETWAYLYFVFIHSSHTVTIISSKTLYLYNELLDRFAKLQMDLYNLNATYHDLLKNYGVLLGNYSLLQQSYQELFNSYQEHLLDYFEHMDNIRNLMYIFAATTAIFIITTIYLSKRAHASKTSAC